MATHLYIDGYNLIAQIWGMGQGRAELTRQRNDLVRQLAAYHRRRPLPIEVVFDGWRDGHELGNREMHGGVVVSYSPKGITADEVLRERVQGRGTGALVVSADRQVQRWAREGGGEALDPVLFYQRLNMAQHDTALEVDDRETKDESDDNGWSGSTNKKGNAFRRSKRDRALNQRTKKL